HLRQHSSQVGFYTGALRWIGLSGSYNQGAGANYSPSSGLLPFVANTKNASFGVTLRPLPRLRFDETYIYTHLGAPQRSLVRANETSHILDDHIARSKLNYQFSRALSLRLIIDYHGLLPNPSLISQQQTKRIGGDV